MSTLPNHLRRPLHVLISLIDIGDLVSSLPQVRLMKNHGLTAVVSDHAMLRMSRVSAPCSHPHPSRWGMLAGLNRRHRIFRLLQKPLHFLHTHLLHRVVLMPHYLLHARGIRIIEKRTLRGRSSLPSSPGVVNSRTF